MCYTTANIVVIDNRNEASIEPFQANYIKTFNGMCILVLKSKKGEQGEIKIEASVQGLKTSYVTINAKLKICQHLIM